MKKHLFIFLIAILLSSCESSREYQERMDKERIEDYDPCRDPRFLELQRKPIDSLTTREYDFMRRKEDECNKYKENKNSSSPAVTAIIVTVVVVATLWLIARVL